MMDDDDPQAILVNSFSSFLFFPSYHQLFVAAVSPARNPSSSYQAWGHSTVVGPWGDILATTGHEPATVYAELDLSKAEEMRQNIPTSQQKRLDLYSTCAEK